jgi:hypothetical protein
VKININYINKNDIFELQVIDKKLRSHFLLSRAELNSLRTVLERALLSSKQTKDKKNENE